MHITYSRIGGTSTNVNWMYALIHSIFIISCRDRVWLFCIIEIYLWVQWVHNATTQWTYEAYFIIYVIQYKCNLESRKWLCAQQGFNVYVFNYAFIKISPHSQVKTQIVHMPCCPHNTHIKLYKHYFYQDVTSNLQRLLDDRRNPQDILVRFSFHAPVLHIYIYIS